MTRDRPATSKTRMPASIAAGYVVPPPRKCWDSFSNRLHRDELVAHASCCNQPARMARIRLELAAQIRDVDGDRPTVADEGALPEMATELAIREVAARP